MGKTLDRKTVTQLRDSLLEDYNDLRKGKNPAENFGTQEAVLASQINILSYVLGHSFNLFRGEIGVWPESPDKMYTKSTEKDE